MTSRSSFEGRKLNINQFAIPVRAINQKATSRSITPALGNVDSRTMANRALWGEYWKLYSQFHKSHRDYIARPLSGIIQVEELSVKCFNSMMTVLIK